jgi:hypothetical protein
MRGYHARVFNAGTAAKYTSLLTGGRSNSRARAPYPPASAPTLYRDAIAL